MQMEFMPMRALSSEQRTVLANLRRDGELVITNNGQPTIFMIDLSGRDLIEVAGYFRRNQNAKTLAQRQSEAIKRFVDDKRGDDVELFDEEFDLIMKNRLNITRELDI